MESGVGVGKYSDDLMEWLKFEGYTHCFFVAGGNAMHLIDSASRIFISIPFVHEVGAAIAADSFNEVAKNGEKAFVVVTAGPGLTNITTGVASSWVDRRQLLILGGQAKSTDLSRGKVKQRGFQEIGGVEILSSISKKSILVDKQLSRSEIVKLARESQTPPKGPVFLEICLDVSMQPTLVDTGVKAEELKFEHTDLEVHQIVDEICNLLKNSKRPLILIGGGVDRYSSTEAITQLRNSKIPISTSFNGGDRIGFDYEYYCGRPNWYGSRWANILIQQCDLLIAVGSRLGLMNTGYNENEFMPAGKIIQIEVEASEIRNDLPNFKLGFQLDPNKFLNSFASRMSETLEIDEWRDFIALVRRELSSAEKTNVARDNYIEYYSFIDELMTHTKSNDQINPCSSGGNFESYGRVMKNISGQNIVTSPGLASMGFGLSGGIGMYLANPSRRTLVFEGDGGLAQNLQEFGVMKSINANIKFFIADNGNYGSIKTNQKIAFNNYYVGCDKETGLYLPNWEKIADAFEIQSYVINKKTAFSEEFFSLFTNSEPVIFIVKLDPDQIFYPRISSKKNTDGSVVSSPLHQMEPPLGEEQELKFFKYI